MPKECSVCLDKAWWINRVRTPCGHCFHRKCLRESLRATGRCPYCRVPVFDTSINFLVSGYERRTGHKTKAGMATSVAVRPLGLLVWIPTGRTMATHWICYADMKLATASPGERKLEIVHQTSDNFLSVTTFSIRTFAGPNVEENLESVCKSIRAYIEDQPQ